MDYPSPKTKEPGWFPDTKEIIDSSKEELQASFEIAKRTLKNMKWRRRMVNLSMCGS